MLKVTVYSLSLLMLCVCLAGCGGPDPRDNPDFNEAAGANPGAVKMEPLKQAKPGSAS